MNFDQTIINAVFGAVGTLCGFVLKAMWDAITRLREDMGTLNDKIAKEYVRRDDFRDHAQRVETLLDRIYAKVEAKADK